MAKTRRAPEEDEVRRRPDDEDEAPRRARRDDADEPDEDEPLTPRKKRKSARGPIKLIVRICAGVVGAILLMIVLWWVYTPIGTDSSMLCYFPPETVSLSGYDVSDGLNNAKFKEVHDLLVNNYKFTAGRRFGADSGIDDKAVVKYMSGQVAGKPDEEKDLPPQERRGAITVLRFRNAIDQNKLIGSFNREYFAEERTHRDGRKYYHLFRNTQEREEDVSFFIPNSRTLVYATTWRELEECMTRVPGRVVVEGDMRELANKVDGTYYSASTDWAEYNGQPNAIAFGLGFVDSEVRDQKTYSGRNGTAMWIGDNGNDFLFASAVMYSDIRTAREVRNKIQASFYKAQAQIYQSESSKPSGLEDPFNPKPKEVPGAQPGFGGGGGGQQSEQAKDILEGLAEYAKTGRAYNRGRLVVVEGMISHGTPEQGTFEKFWKAISGKFSATRGGGFPGGPGGMMPGMPGGGMPMPGGGGPPMPGAPGGPPR